MNQWSETARIFKSGIDNFLGAHKAALDNMGYGEPWPNEFATKTRSYYAQAYYYRRKERTPAWTDIDKILGVYADARWLTKVTGIKFSVDHGLPLYGKLVSGLHVENNLQILTKYENSGKKNKFSVE